MPPQLNKLCWMFLLCLTWNNVLFSQIKISTDGSVPDPSAMLEIKSSSKGFLPPRVADTNAVANAAEGTLIYDMGSHCMRYFNGVIWSDCMGNIEPSWRCGDMLADTRDAQSYPTVLIGDQCWMAENLNVGTMINGTTNPSNNGIIEKYCYSDNTSNCNVSGGLYRWDEMMEYVTTNGTQGICPDGWHLPTDAEWCDLEQYLDPTITCNSTGLRGVDAGGKLKETGTVHWYPPNTGATNSSGFTALPGGFLASGVFYDFPYIAFFWTSSENNSSSAWRRWLLYAYSSITRDTQTKDYSASVRCLKDEN